MALFWITATPASAAPKPALSSLATALVLRLSAGPAPIDPTAKTSTD